MQCVKKLGKEAPTTIRAGTGFAEDALKKVCYEKILICSKDIIRVRYHKPTSSCPGSLSHQTCELGTSANQDTVGMIYKISTTRMDLLDGNPWGLPDMSKLEKVVCTNLHTPRSMRNANNGHGR